jgi:hypothetical protein
VPDRRKDRKDVTDLIEHGPHSSQVLGGALGPEAVHRIGERDFVVPAQQENMPGCRTL